MIVDGFRIETLTPERWDHLVTVLGRSGMSGCWCMYWALPNQRLWGESAKGGAKARNKAAFRDLVDAGPPPGLLAYEADEPIGWCRVMPRDRLPSLANSRYFKTDLDIEGVWSLPCFVVRPKHRGRGLTAVLTKAAIAFALSSRVQATPVSCCRWFDHCTIETATPSCDKIAFTTSGSRKASAIPDI